MFYIALSLVLIFQFNIEEEYSGSGVNYVVEILRLDLFLGVDFRSKSCC